MIQKNIIHPDFVKYQNKQPKAVKAFVYYRQLKTGQIHDMPYHDWIDVQRNPKRREQFEYIRLVDLEAMEAPQEVIAGVPVKEDPFECPLCGFIAKGESELKGHKIKIHG